MADIDTEHAVVDPTDLTEGDVVVLHTEDGDAEMTVDVPEYGDHEVRLRTEGGEARYLWLPMEYAFAPQESVITTGPGRTGNGAVVESVEVR